MTTVWRALAEVVVGVHYAFLLYLVGGGFLALRWPRTIWLHLAAAVWGALIVSTKVTCPLTVAQNVFRERGGLEPLHAGFITGYVKGTLYPARYETATQLLVALVVLASWALFVRHVRVRRRGVGAVSAAGRGRPVRSRPTPR